MLQSKAGKNLISYQLSYNAHDVLFLTKPQKLEFLWAWI